MIPPHDSMGPIAASTPAAPPPMVLRTFWAHYTLTAPVTAGMSLGDSTLASGGQLRLQPSSVVLAASFDSANVPGLTVTMLFNVGQYTVYLDGVDVTADTSPGTGNSAIDLNSGTWPIGAVLTITSEAGI